MNAFIGATASIVSIPFPSPCGEKIVMNIHFNNEIRLFLGRFRPLAGKR